jgi:hypothetical protein
MDSIFLWAKVEHSVHIWETNHFILKTMQSKWTQKCPRELKFSAMKLKSVMSLGWWLIHPPISFIIHLSLSLIEEAFGKMSLQFFRAKELRS